MAVAVAPTLVAKKTSFYRPELDALRFFAFFAVFMFHMPRKAGLIGNAVMQSGVFGVDLFFCLSAYLITELLLREKDSTGKLDVKSFYIRRILRIWPLYFCFIALACVPWFDPAHTFTWKRIAAFLLLSGNLGVIAWGWPLHSIVMPLWTVSIEEQFYLCWPPIVRVLTRRGITIAALGMLYLSSTVRALTVYYHGGTNSVWCNTLCRLDPIALGILLAVFLNGRPVRLSFVSRTIAMASAITALAFVANVWKINGPEILEWLPTMVGFPLVALSCLLLLVSTLGISDIPHWLSYLGKISYGLYVYHQLGIFLSDKVIHGLLRVPVALGLTIAISAASYAWLESPFLRIKERFAKVKSRPV